MGLPRKITPQRGSSVGATKKKKEWRKQISQISHKKVYCFLTCDGCETEVQKSPCGPHRGEKIIFEMWGGGGEECSR